MENMAQLDIPDCTYNWLVDFFNGHSHHTKYNEQTSTLKTISANIIQTSIIQGSAIGPASYAVDASDLRAATDANALCKYVDDTYLIIPAVNVDSRSTEIHNVNQWALALKLKTQFVEKPRSYFYRPKMKN